MDLAQESQESQEAQESQESQESESPDSPFTVRCISQHQQRSQSQQMIRTPPPKAVWKHRLIASRVLRWTLGQLGAAHSIA